MWLMQQRPCWRPGRGALCRPRGLATRLLLSLLGELAHGRLAKMVRATPCGPFSGCHVCALDLWHRSCTPSVESAAGPCGTVALCGGVLCHATRTLPPPSHHAAHALCSSRRPHARPPRAPGPTCTAHFVADRRFLAVPSQAFRLLFLGLAYTATTTTALEPGCATVGTSPPPIPAGTNVLLASDKTISYETNAGLPGLPATANTFVYGPSKSCAFDGIITVGGPNSLNKLDIQGGHSLTGRFAMMMFVDWLNNERGGLKVGAKLYGMRIVLVDSAGDRAQNMNATAHASRLWNADFLISQFGSAFATYTAKQSYAEGKLLMTWGASSTAVHTQNNLTFGSLTAAPSWMWSTLTAIAVAASEVDTGARPSTARCAAPSCRSSLKVAFVVMSNSGFGMSMCKGAERKARELQFSIVEDTDGTALMTMVPRGLSVEFAKGVLSTLRAAGANVIIECSTASVARTMLEGEEELDYTPLTHSGVTSASGTGWGDDVNAGWWQGEYHHSPTGWAPTSPVVGEFSGLDSPTFAAKFRARFDMDASANSATVYSLLAALSAAIEGAGTLDTAAVALFLEGMDTNEFYIRFKYNSNHQNTGDLICVQAMMRDVPVQAVAPPEKTEAGVKFAFPTPTYNQRRCQYLGPGQPVGRKSAGRNGLTGAWITDAMTTRAKKECSGNGLCSVAGECICISGYTGNLCELVKKETPPTMKSRASELDNARGCQTVAMSTKSSCISTPNYICGATCTDAKPRSSVLHMSFSSEIASRDHFKLSGYSAAGIAQGSPAGLSCDGGSVVEVSYAQLSGNSQNGTGAAAIFVRSATLKVLFAKIDANTNTGSGAAGILVQNKSTLEVLHTDFVRNKMEGNTANGSAITCHGSMATVNHSRFTENRGAAVVLTDCSFMMQHAALHDNWACTDDSGSKCSRSAAIVIGGGSIASIIKSTLFNNQGSAAGAIFTTGINTRLSAVDCMFQSNRGLNVGKASGAVMLTAAATAVIRSCIFDNNLGTAPTAAGAVMSADAELSMFESRVSDNRIQANPHAIAGAGGIYSERSSVSLADSDVSSNDAVNEAISHASTVSFGKLFYALSPTRAYVINSTFQPFDDTLSALISPGASKGSLRGSCDEYPCKPGFGCTYINASLLCTPCSATTHSANGIACQLCLSGLGPTHDQTGCAACGGNNHSEFGVCDPCPDGLVVEDNHIGCTKCDGDQTAISTVPGQAHACTCADTFYNVTASLHVCFYNGFDSDEQSSARDMASKVQYDCDTCPSDAKQDPCLVCKGGGIQIAPGFTAPPIANSAGGTSVVSVFRCHPDIEVARKRCPGTADGRRLAVVESTMNPECAQGYSGHICGECDDDWGMNTDRECEPCESGASGTVGSIFILLGMIAGLALILGVAAKLWKGFPLKHLLRCSVQPMRILITYSQVTTQLGDVLNFAYPGIFGDVLDFLKPILDIWGLLFRALGPSECFGVSGFTSSWLLRVIGLPAIMSTVVLIIFLRSRSSAEAAMAAKGNFFFVVFFCYPTICIICFASFICTQMTPDSSVLDVDDSVTCEDGSHITMQILSYIVIVVVAVGLPVALLYVLLRKIKTYEKESQGTNYDTAKRIAVELDVDVQAAQFVIRDITIGRDYSFVMDAFKPQYIYWEAMDMFRKLALVGLVLVVGRGTVAQLSTAIVLAFTFFAIHVKTWPYKIQQDNLFRAAT
jgi:ABC-type branched-subunit amino acid transport system substrate-binding protein